MLLNEFFPEPDNFYEILESEFARAKRYGIDITLFFIKLGQVEEIVSKYGQLTAIRILRDVYDLICQNIRKCDREFIYGDDEFMIILPNTPKANAQHLITKLKRVIENYTYTDNSDVSFALTPRFGVSSYPLDVRTGEEDKI